MYISASVELLVLVSFLNEKTQMLPKKLDNRCAKNAYDAHAGTSFSVPPSPLLD